MEKKIFFKTLLLFIAFSVIGFSDQHSKEDKTRRNNQKLNIEDSLWDVQLVINLPGGFGAEFDGSFFYVTDGFSSLINKYDISGNLIEVFSIPGISGLDDLAYDGMYMYGGTGSSNIFQMDFTTHSLVGTIVTPFSVRHIAYDENYDAFWIGSWSSPLALISRTGTVLNIFNILLPTITGTAYDNVSPDGPYLWFFDRGDTIPGPQLIKQFNINSGTFTGVTHDVLSDVGLGQPDAIAGGLFSTAELIQGTFSLGGILIGSPTILFAYEILNPIPVELISFTADYYNGKVFLSWTTATEVNNKGFEIEKQIGSKQSAVNNWETIGFVEGSGTTTNPQFYNFSYEEIEAGTYQFRLKQIDFDGSFNYLEIIELEIISSKKFSLSQNYPNPFNPSTKIEFTIPSAGSSLMRFVQLKVYDVLGNEVAEIVNEYKLVGTYEAEFSAKGGSAYEGDASNLPSGIYFYQLKAGSFIQTKKMILFK